MDGNRASRLALWLLLAYALLPALFFIVWGLAVIRAGGPMRETEAPLSAGEKAVESTLRKRFAWIFGGEGVAIFLAVNILANIGKSAFLVPTIGVIVGLHFLPLARVFRFSLYYWTGAIQTVLCLVTAIAMPSRLNVLNTVVGLEMALSVWITILAVLIRARHLQRTA